MQDTLYMAIVIVAFFALTLFAIHQDENRKAERRQKTLPVPVERRKRDRRSHSIHSYFAWVIRSKFSRIPKR